MLSRMDQFWVQLGSGKSVTCGQQQDELPLATVLSAVTQD